MKEFAADATEKVQDVAADVTDKVKDVFDRDQPQAAPVAPETPAGA